MMIGSVGAFCPAAGAGVAAGAPHAASTTAATAEAIVIREFTVLNIIQFLYAADAHADEIFRMNIY
jgi:hypothetical protein